MKNVAIYFIPFFVLLSCPFADICFSAGGGDSINRQPYTDVSEGFYNPNRGNLSQKPILGGGGMNEPTPEKFPGRFDGRVFWYPEKEEESDAESRQRRKKKNSNDSSNWQLNPEIFDPEPVDPLIIEIGEDGEVERRRGFE